MRKKIRKCAEKIIIYEQRDICIGNACHTSLFALHSPFAVDRDCRIVIFIHPKKFFIVTLPVIEKETGKTRRNTKNVKKM
jgi:hypothetical protein